MSKGSGFELNAFGAGCLELSHPAQALAFSGRCAAIAAQASPYAGWRAAILFREARL
jgi:hypothetical protein